MYEVEMLIENMVQLLKNNYIGMAVLRGRFILKGVIYILSLSSETRGLVILNLYYTQENTFQGAQ